VKLEVHSTTILSVRRGGSVVVAGDGQVTLGNTIVKGGAHKVRRLGEGRAIGGFAGSAADGIALFERLDAKLREQRSPLRRAAVELAKEWRTDRALCAGSRRCSSWPTPRRRSSCRARAT
jgi:ATP-dependent HslUV protease subunit HslV